MSTRFVVTITIIFRRESDVFRDTFGVTALEWLGVFPLVLAVDGQQQNLPASKDMRLTFDPSGSWA